MIEIDKLLRALHEQRVEFVMIGGAALVSHGHTRFTDDLDICYERSRANLRRLVAALAPFHPRLRGAPPELPFFFDEKTLANGLNFTLTTDVGAIDLLGEVTGVGGYSDLSHSEVHELFEMPIQVMSLDDLERAKIAAGRPKDLADLEAIRELKRGA